MKDRQDSAAQIVEFASDAIFGRPLVVNVFRSILVEAIVASTVSKHWTWCSTDWAAYDFLHEDGARLEVKQSAARQSWAKDTGNNVRCAFDIAPRTGYWQDGVNWIHEPGRNADIYVFAHHPVEDDTADHRRPDQWVFYVLPTTALPAQKSISVSNVRKLAHSCNFDDLGSAIEITRKELHLNDKPAI